MRLALPETIETPRLLIQRLRYEDAEEMFYTYASKPEATRFVSWPTHQSLLNTRAYLKYAVEGWTKGTEYSFSIRMRKNSRMIGSFGILHDEGKIQLGYILGPLHWGHGYATEACQSIIQLLKMSPHVYRVGTFVDSENVGSIRVLLKSGLVEEARLQQWFRFVNQGNQAKDCVLFSLPLK